MATAVQILQAQISAWAAANSISLSAARLTSLLNACPAFIDALASADVPVKALRKVIHTPSGKTGLIEGTAYVRDATPQRVAWFVSDDGTMLGYVDPATLVLV